MPNFVHVYNNSLFKDYKNVYVIIFMHFYMCWVYFSGGRTLTIHGTRLYAIQKPIIYAVVGDKGVGSVVNKIILRR